jgi:hypothetical protein
MKINNHKLIKIEDSYYPLRGAYNLYLNLKHKYGHNDWEMFKEVLELSDWNGYGDFMDALDQLGPIDGNPSVQLAIIEKQIKINKGIYKEEKNVFDDIKTFIKTLIGR